MADPTLSLSGLSPQRLHWHMLKTIDSLGDILQVLEQHLGSLKCVSLMLRAKLCCCQNSNNIAMDWCRYQAWSTINVLCVCVCCGRCIGRLSRCYWNGVNITLWGLSLSVLRKPCHGKLFLNVLSWVICLIQISEEVWSMTLTPMVYHWHHSKDGEWAACQVVLHSWVASTMLLSCHRSGRNKTRKSFFVFAGEHDIAQHRAVWWFVKIIVIAFERRLRKLPSYRSKLLSFKTLNLGFRYLKEIYKNKKNRCRKEQHKQEEKLRWKVKNNCYQPCSVTSRGCRVRLVKYSWV